tara:strand:- start:4868 stop:7153 length:2286 start_codon:yes stop_codon:yes gene_type:complete
MPQKALLSVLFVFYCTFLFAQTATVRGKVQTQESKNTEFVNIYVKGTTIGTATNADGTYELNGVPEGSQTIVASFIGFQQEEKKLSVKSEEIYELNFRLEQGINLMNDIVVTGTMKEMSKLNSPVSVEVYSAQYFENNKSPSIFEALQNVNGVRPQLNCSVCNTGDIHINGLEGPYTMVLIDGMPIVSGLSTVYGLTGIPASLIERVEIVKGPSSALYGSEAVGGLINVITKKPLNAPLLSADVFSTSWGEINADIGAKYKLGKKASALVGLNYFNYQKPIDNNNDDFTDITLQDRISLFNKISFKRKNNKQFNIGTRFVYEDRWGGNMNWNSEYRGGDSVYGESIYTRRSEVFGNYELPTNENFNLQFSANGHNQNSVYGNTIYKADQRIGFGQLTWNKELFNSHDILVGAAYRYTFYDDNTTATLSFDSLLNEPQEIHLPGIFIQDQIAINEFNTLLLGVRYDYNSIHGNIFSPRINYKWNTEDNKMVVRLSLGNGFRVANVFTEDHAALTGARDVVFANKLNPETSRNINLNVVKRIYLKDETFLSLDGSVFYTYFNNRIVPDYETNPNQIIYDNLNGSAESKGVSLNVDLRLPNGLKVMGGATLMDVTLDEEGEKMGQLLTERFTAVWNIEYTVLPWNLKLNYTGNVYSPMRLPLLGELDDRSEYSPWFSIQNIQLTKSINKQWELYGGIKNILNFTPAANSIARSFDPFDENVQFNNQGDVVPTANNPNALTFDPTYVYASNQGIRGFLGIKYILK